MTTPGTNSRGYSSRSSIAGLKFLLLLCLTVMANPVKTNSQPVASNRRISPDLQQQLAQTRAQRLTVIMRLKTNAAGNLDSVLRSAGIRVLRTFPKLKTHILTLPTHAVSALGSREEVAYISPDRQLTAFGHLATTTGAEAVRSQTSVSVLGLPISYTLDGSGIGIAVVDSGIASDHSSFRDALGFSRVVYSQDFTGEGRTDDPYGHGTHVASLAAGSNQVSSGAYTGIAPNAKLINLRVLNADGIGSTANLLAALEWLLANSGIYQIKVVNLSLGMPAIDSAANDPACNAVRRLVDEGIVVVAAAGNNGNGLDNNKLYGQIHSPGIDPAVITVGAANTLGSDVRSDDVVTNFSSRGPTRGRWIDETGQAHYDNLIKPDLIAPGNKLVGAASPGNRIAAQHPDLEVNTSAPPRQRMMYLSGSSMASPTVAGAAALLLEANPTLTPNLIKAILMLTAQQLAGFNTFEQGAGQLNLEGAVRLAKLVRRDLSPMTPTGAPLLTSSVPPTSQTVLSGENFFWAGGIVLNHTFATGPNLFMRYQGTYGRGFILGDGVTVSGSTQTLKTTLMTEGLVLSDDLFTSNGFMLGQGDHFLLTALLLGNGTLLSDGILVGDGIVVGDGILVGDGIVVGDSALRGDSTSCME